MSKRENYENAALWLFRLTHDRNLDPSLRMQIQRPGRFPEYITLENALAPLMREPRLLEIRLSKIRKARKVRVIQPENQQEQPE